MKFLVINGPNLNLTQFTEPGMEGQIDFNTLLNYIEAGCAQMDVQVDFFQSNHEGDLIDEIQSAAGRADGIILNPGGYAYYSVAILEALQVCGVPAVEVMLADPSGKEPFRSVDVVSFGCQGRFAGEGVSGYLHACAYLVQLLRLDGGAQTHLVHARPEIADRPPARTERIRSPAPPKGEPLASRAGCAAKRKA